MAPAQSVLSRQSVWLVTVSTTESRAFDIILQRNNDALTCI